MTANVSLELSITYSTCSYINGQAVDQQKLRLVFSDIIPFDNNASFPLCNISLTILSPFLSVHDDKVLDN